jgi:hypothetical protein
MLKQLKDFLTPYINRNYQLISLGDFNINLLEDKTIPHIRCTMLCQTIQ